MERFLKTSKKFTHSSLLEIKEDIHVVIGNQAADLDSVVCALTYAYLLAQRSLTESNTRVIPVIDIPRKDFTLRSEIVYLFNLLKIREDLLTFADEIDLHALHKASKLSLTIVDHNHLSRKYQDLTDCITEIIDHHLDGDQFPECDILIEFVGSCATLIAEQFIDCDSSLLDNEVGLLLLSTILLDTYNLDTNNERTTKRDTEIVEKLETYVDFEDLPFNRQELFSKLKEVKFNMENLSTYDMLRKDYKFASIVGQPIGISSVTISIEKLLERDNLVQDVETFRDENGLISLVIMTIHFNSKDAVERHLLIYENEVNETRTKLGEFLSQQSVLKVESIDSPHPCFQAFRQHNVQASRKVVLPLIKEYLNPSDEYNAKEDNLRKEGTKEEAVQNVATSLSSSQKLEISENDATIDSESESDNSGTYVVNQVDDQEINNPLQNPTIPNNEAVKLIKVSNVNFEAKQQVTNNDESYSDNLSEASDSSDSASYDINPPLEILDYDQENVANKKISSRKTLNEKDNKNDSQYATTASLNNDNIHSLSPIEEESPSASSTSFVQVSENETTDHFMPKGSSRSNNTASTPVINIPKESYTSNDYLPDLSPIAEESPRQISSASLSDILRKGTTTNQSTVNSRSTNEFDTQFLTAIEGKSLDGTQIKSSSTTQNNVHASERSTTEESFSGTETILQSTVCSPEDNEVNNILQSTNVSASNYESCIQDNSKDQTQYNSHEESIAAAAMNHFDDTINSDLARETNTATIITTTSESVSERSYLIKSSLDSTVIADNKVGQKINLAVASDIVESNVTKPISPDINRSLTKDIQLYRDSESSNFVIDEEISGVQTINSVKEESDLLQVDIKRDRTESAIDHIANNISASAIVDALCDVNMKVAYSAASNGTTIVPNSKQEKTAKDGNQTQTHAIEDPVSNAPSSGGKRKSILKVPATLSVSLSSPPYAADDSPITTPPSIKDTVDSNKQEAHVASEEKSNIHKSKPHPRKLKVPKSVSSDIDESTITEYTAEEELKDIRAWRLVTVAGEEKELDLRVVNTYGKLISHGGYTADGSAIIVFSGFYMPKKSVSSYSYVLEHVYRYVISTIQALVVDCYYIIFFTGAMPKDAYPSIKWLRKCYKTLDRRLRKNLGGLYLVQPSFKVKTFVRLTRLFVSPKFSRKIKFVRSIEELGKLVPLDRVTISDADRSCDKSK